MQPDVPSSETTASQFCHSWFREGAWRAVVAVLNVPDEEAEPMYGDYAELLS
jgi:hypothetical protein